MKKVIRDGIKELRGQGAPHGYIKRARSLSEFGMKINTVGTLPMSSTNKGHGQAVSRRQTAGVEMLLSGYVAWVSAGRELRPIDMAVCERKNLIQQPPLVRAAEEALFVAKARFLRMGKVKNV